LIRESIVRTSNIEKVKKSTSARKVKDLGRSGGGDDAEAQALGVTMFSMMPDFA